MEWFLYDQTSSSNSSSTANGPKRFLSNHIQENLPLVEAGVGSGFRSPPSQLLSKLTDLTGLVLFRILCHTQPVAMQGESVVGLVVRTMTHSGMDLFRAPRESADSREARATREWPGSRGARGARETNLFSRGARAPREQAIC